MVPGNLDSMYDLGYVIVGRGSIFFISTIIAINSFGILIIYFIIYGDILKTLVAQLAFENKGMNDPDNFFIRDRTFYVIKMAILLFYLVL